MRLEKITIDNFRCFEHLEIEFFHTDGLGDSSSVSSLMKSVGTTIFVAKNGAGKTAILDAIAYLLNVVVSRFPNVPTRTFKETDFREVWRGAPQPKLLSSDREWERLPKSPYMRLTAQATDGVRWDTTKSRDSSPKTKGLIPKPIGRQEIFAKADEWIDRFNLETPPTERFPIFGYYATDRAVIYKKPERKRNLQKKFDFYDAYRGALDGNLNYKKMIAWVQYLKDKQFEGMQVVRDLDYKTFEQQTMQLALERMLPGFKNLRLGLRPLDLEIDWEEEENSFKTCRLASQLSDGHKTALLMVLDIVSRMLILNANIPKITPEHLLESPGIVLIDEVDLHLHPSWQQRIAVDLQRTFPRVQFIMTTHSPQVISSLPKEIVRIIDQEEVVSYDTQTQGVESQRILQEVFSTSTVPESDEYVQELRRYAQLEAEEKADTEEGRGLYKKLESHFSEQYPPLQRIEIHKRFIAARKSRGSKDA